MAQSRPGMEIVLYPDPRLRAKNAPIEAFDEELAQLSREMLALMYRTDGVGLAAPQVGVNRRLIVFNPEGDPAQSESELVLCNPRILVKGREKSVREEGCLSFPGINFSVERPRFVRVEAQDLHGRVQHYDFEDFTARVFQHEFDHLEGMLFIDRMTPAEGLKVRPLLAELESEFRTRA